MHLLRFHGHLLRGTREPVDVTVWQPQLGGLLPVYVKDRYPGFSVKTFVECSSEEVETYVGAMPARSRLSWRAAT